MEIDPELLALMEDSESLSEQQAHARRWANGTPSTAEEHELVRPLMDFIDERPPEPVLWRLKWQGKAPVAARGEVSILSGAGGSGKSLFSLQVGIQPGDVGLDRAEGNVVYLNYEDSAARLAPRARQLGRGAIPEDIFFVPNPEPLCTVTKDHKLEPAASWDRLWKAIRAVQPAIVVIDPVSAALADVSLNDGGPVRQFMRLLAAEATHAKLGVMLIAHDTKQGRGSSDPGAGAVSGSATWWDAARSVIYLKKESPSKWRLSSLKSNYGDPADIDFELAELVNGNRQFIGLKEPPPGAKMEDAQDVFGGAIA